MSSDGIKSSDEQPNSGERKDPKTNKDAGYIGMLRHGGVENEEIEMNLARSLSCTISGINSD
jgi:hypothetical protein